MKRLLIVGGGFLQDFVIQKAKQLGYYVIAIDGDKNAVGFAHSDESAVIDIKNQEECLLFAKTKKIDGVLTAATDYGVLTTSFIAQEMNLPGLDYNVAKLIKNKYQIRKCLSAHKVDDTENVFEVSSTEDISKINKLVKFPVMVKPCDGSGSRGASRVDDYESLSDACRLAIQSSVSYKAEIEPFITGKEYGAESFVYDGKVYVLAIMRKWMTEPPYYAELGHCIPSGLDSSVEKKAKQYVSNAITSLGINFGAVNMDLIITDNGSIHIVDIGARMGGNLIGSHIIPYGTGIDYMACIIKAAVGDKIDLAPTSHESVCSRLLAFKGGIVKHFPDTEKIKVDYGVEIYHHLKVGDIVNEYHTNLDGCGYIVSKKSTIDEAIKTADSALNHIKEAIF